MVGTEGHGGTPNGSPAAHDKSTEIIVLYGWGGVGLSRDCSYAICILEGGQNCLRVWNCLRQNTT